LWEEAAANQLILKREVKERNLTRFIPELSRSVILSGAKDPENARVTTDALRHSIDSAALHVMREHQYFVYIMSSNSGTLYTGITNNVYRRALQHKEGKIEGFCRKYHCNRLVHYESYDDVHRAIGREKQKAGPARRRLH
jgi:putative endonuclease